jgi:O-antigen/teichoic acid export membrane protein
MLTLAARSMSAHDFGQFALWFNAVSFLAVVAGGGQEKLVIRSWNEYLGATQFGLARGSLVIGATASTAAAVLICLMGFVAGLLFGADHGLLLAAAFFLVLQTIYTFTTHATRAIIGVASSDGHEITWRLIVIFGTGGAILLGAPLGSTGIFAFAALGTVLALAMQLLSIYRGCPPAVRKAAAEFELGPWASRSLRMWSAGVLEAANQYLEVLLIGLVLSPTAAGGYFVASRFANVFAMVAGSLNNFSAREIARDHYGAAAQRVLETLRKIGLISTLLVVAGIAIVIGAGRELLALFGPAYVSHYPLLVILSVGTACLTLAGPAPAILLVTGHEGLYSRIVALAGLARCVALAMLAWAYGPVGAAVASAGASIGLAIALTAACRRHANLDPAVTALFAKPMRGVP